MEFTKEFVEEHGLSEEQVGALTGYVQNEIVPTIKKEYDGKANENAEGILSGASKYAKEKLGIDVEREKGEKYGDYLTRLFDTGLSKTKSALETKEKEIEEKLKNFKGGDEYKAQLEALKNEKDDLMKQVAELEPLKGVDEKYREATETLTGLKKEVAYNSIKPNFPEGANKYEVDAKWNEFKKAVEEKYNIELVDGKPMAVDKENHHKVVELSTLLEADSNIKELLQGRQQKGTGATPVDFKEVEGVPFKVPKGIDSTEQSRLVREYLVNELGSNLHPEYNKKFGELLTKIKSAK